MVILVVDFEDKLNIGILNTDIHPLTLILFKRN